VWNGVQAVQSRGIASWSEEEVMWGRASPFVATALVSPIKSIGVLTEACLPGNMGLFMAGNPWSVYLARFSGLHTEGREVIAGRSCLVLIGDMDGARNDEEYQYPWRICVDDADTLLVMKLESFIDHAPGPGGKGNSGVGNGQELHLGSQTWYRQSYVRVESFAELAPHVYIGTQGVSGVDEYPGIQTRTRIDPTRSWIGQSAPPWFADSGIERGVFVQDNIVERSYYSGHADDAAYVHNRRLLDLICKMLSDGRSECERDVRSGDALVRSSQTAVITYAAARLCGLRSVSLAGVCELLAARAGPTGAATEMDDIERVLRESAARVHRSAPHSVEYVSEQILVAEIEGSTSEQTEIVLCIRSAPETVLALGGSRDRHALSWSEFCSRAVGQIVVLEASSGKSAIVPIAVERTVDHSSPSSRSTLAAIALATLGLAAGMLIWRTRIPKPSGGTEREMNTDE
jgi:hypothetical protein